MRFRITQTVDLSAGSTTVSYAAGKAAVVEEVEAWLDSFLVIG